MKKSIIATVTTVLVAFTAAIGITATSHAQNDPTIPVILNYAGDTWIDQNGEAMETEAAESFLENNPQYAHEILFLNQNQWYATNLQNDARNEAIEAAQKACSEHLYRGSADDDRSAYQSAAQDIAIDPPSENALNKLIVHLQNNAAIYRVKDICSLYTNGAIEANSGEQAADYLFFNSLAKNYDSGELDEACGAPITETASPQIPAILTGDNQTWLDQNGEIMDEERAVFFLATNKRYARTILQLNDNSRYLTSWQSDAHSAVIDKLWTDLQLTNGRKNHYAADYTWVIEDILNNPPSPEILRTYQESLLRDRAADYISDLLNYLAPDRHNDQYAGDVEKEAQIATCIHELKGSGLPEYVFWCAVAKATENGAFNPTE